MPTYIFSIARCLRVVSWIIFALTLSGFAPRFGKCATSAQVEFFSPQGTVKNVRQATARFTLTMVALGDPRLADPFTVDCPAPGKGRWADGRNWVYDFDEDLPAGLRCSFTIKQGLKALDGTPVTGTRTFSFDTGGPAVLASFPQDGWRVIDEEQIFLLKLDAPAAMDAVRKHACFIIEGISERIPFEILTGDARKAVLSQRKELGYAYYEILWKSGRDSNIRVRDRKLEAAEELILVIKSNRRFPPAVRVDLVWGAGIAAVKGPATTQDQRLTFQVRPAFTASVECSRTNAQAGCIPMLPIRVSFSAPVARAKAMGVHLMAADGAVFHPDRSETDKAPYLEGLIFKGPFPESHTLTVHLPEGLVDDMGRPLQNAARFPLEIRVDEYPPLAKFSGEFGILELKEGGILPVTLRNVEAEMPARRVDIPGRIMRLGQDPAEIASWLQRVEEAARPSGEWVEKEAEDRSVWREATGTISVFAGADSTKPFTVTKPLGNRPSEVVGIPLKDPGFYVVELESRVLGASLLGRDETRYVATSALVTNMAVHFKWGRESSRVWVTSLDDAKPVPRASLTVTDYCSGASLWQGSTDGDGIAIIGHSLGQPHSGTRCSNRWASHPLLVTAQKGEDFSFAVSGWSRGISPYDFGIEMGSEWNADIYHTVLDRPLFRAGETVFMKHFLRRHRIDGIAIQPDMPSTREVTIFHFGSGQNYELTASFGADGVAEQKWTIPKEAKLGDYGIVIRDSSNSGHQSGRFKVEEFRLPTMRATVQGPARPLVNASEVKLDLQVSYVSGGGAANLPVTLRTLVEPRPIQFPDYEDFEFGGAPVKEGIVESSGSMYDYDFESEDEADSQEEDEEGAIATPKARVMPLTLDSQGVARVTIPKLPAIEGAAQLIAELEYADANGEILTSTGRVRLLPSAVSIGIRREGWVASEKQMRFRVVALDLDGHPIAKQPVAVTLYQSTAYSYRKRLIGGFYAYNTITETKKLSTQCAGKTDAQGLLTCEVAPGVSGQVILRAESRDGSGNPAGATTSIWVAGEDDWWFGGTAGDRMDVLPEMKEYDAGQVARLQVRMPFRSATALVTVEREGVIQSFVTKLSGRNPVIKLPIRDNFSPNVFVSVLTVRGRVARSERSQSQRTVGSEDITALVDLNKPAYRLGEAEIRVGWKPHRLNVRMTPERTTYRVREKAQVRIQVTRANGSPLPGGTEVAVAAVDEALLELASNRSWALLDAMMGKRGLEVWTSTAQMHVVGKRHYGRKAVLQGGGGGRERMRELFDTLLLWQPRLVLDSKGEATVSIPLNDSMTSFRIAGIAHSGAQLFGIGTATVVTTQDVILLSALPPLVREGDSYLASFTVRNTTDHDLQINVNASTIPAPERASDKSLNAAVTLHGGEARQVAWEYTAPVGHDKVTWTVSASDPGGGALDSLKIVQNVIPAYPVRTYQATIAQLTSPIAMPAERPKGSIAGRGGLEISLRAKLGNGTDGIREYMRFYSYICLEQNISRAVALRDRAMWDYWMQRLPAYFDRDGLLKYFVSDRLEGEDTLTAYVLAIAHEAGWEIPGSPRERMINALRGFVDGRIVRRSALPTADLTIRKLAAIDALSRYGMARAGMLDSITIEPNLWPTSAVIDWLGILDRVKDIRNAAERRRFALNALRSRLNFQGTIMSFSTGRSDALWWLMISEDSNAVRMLLAVLRESTWREDIPRLVRGALGRQQRGHWNTTVANAWGALALEKFSAAFEATPVTGSTAVQFGTEKKSITWPRAADADLLNLPWQPQRATLDVRHQGAGSPWLMVRATAALPLDAPLSTGYKINRTVIPVTQAVAGRWTAGDVARVRLELEAQSDMSWVVVDDPIPGGSTALGSGLGGQSQILQRGERREGWVWPAFEERRFEAFRAYYRFVPKGKWTVEYTVRFNNPGTFLLPATRVEALYAPEMLGESPNAAVIVEAGK
ncbi:MAG: hypothetical protein JXA73_26340 [Acidobacteria bacterium]|nr:hypothetical protein [Acidobacteriota bacterium]